MSKNNIIPYINLEYNPEKLKERAAHWKEIKEAYEEFKDYPDDDPLHFQPWTPISKKTHTHLFEDMLWDKGAVIIGIYPTNDKNYQENDILTNGIGRYTNNNGLSIEFKFECELNL